MSLSSAKKKQLYQHNIAAAVFAVIRLVIVVITIITVTTTTRCETRRTCSTNGKT